MTAWRKCFFHCVLDAVGLAVFKTVFEFCARHVRDVKALKVGMHTSLAAERTLGASFTQPEGPCRDLERMDELNTTTTYLRLHEEAAVHPNYDGAVELQDMCGSVELILVRGELATDDSEQRTTRHYHDDLLDSVARDALASGRIGGGNALLRECQEKLRAAVAFLEAGVEAEAGAAGVAFVDGVAAGFVAGQMKRTCFCGVSVKFNFQW
ncbi:hypothetical protein B0H13DRAFT_1850353 [Mycena leptocephala]|nr:hypothetical protein B0H13DRAFT_1850353 [Mycena leptocephala]